MIAILAMDEAGGIGKNGTLPWEKDKLDMEFFRRVTLDKTVIMGRRTWEDEAMPKPLKHRLNVVIGRMSNLAEAPDIENTMFTPRFDVKMFDKYFKDPVLIGGASIYNQAIREQSIDRFVINIKPGNYGCDTFIDLNYLNENYYSVDATYSLGKESIPFKSYYRKP